MNVEGCGREEGGGKRAEKPAKLARAQKHGLRGCAGGCGDWCVVVWVDVWGKGIVHFTSGSLEPRGWPRVAN